MNLFSVMLGLGASLGVLRVTQNVPRWQAPRWQTCALITLAGALLGARISFVLLHGGYYSQHPLEALYIWQGGLSWMGAVAGGLLFMAWVGWRWHWSLAVTADGVSPLIAPLGILTWLGCWASGTAYGMALDSGVPWALPARDETGVVAARLPVQLMAAFSLLVFFLWLELKSRDWRKAGQRSSMALLGLSLNLFIFSFLRADPAPSWGGLRADCWIAAGFVLGSVGAVLRAFLRSTKPMRSILKG